MEKMRRLPAKGVFGVSLKISFSLYMAAGLLAAFFLALALGALCQRGENDIWKKYEPFREEKTAYLVDEETGERLQMDLHVYMRDIRQMMTVRDRFLCDILSILSIFLIPVCFVLCIAVTGILFYRRKLRTPLELLDRASERIAAQDLDFTVSYEGKDEMGRLCRSFEGMRAALLENNREMWRQMEERKRLNAAFSHDLRTPLTVLKGQCEMLEKYVPEDRMPREKILATVLAMRRHIFRMENYVETMNRLQRLEDLVPEKRAADLDEVFRLLAENGALLCGKSAFRFRASRETSAQICLDLDMVLQVYENLLSNAVRYKKEFISAEVSADADILTIQVRDDGGGFSSEELKNAGRPFYQGRNRAEDPAGTGQLGMGLYISRVLCEKHGGGLKLFNEGSGALAQAWFAVLPDGSEILE